MKKPPYAALSQKFAVLAEKARLHQLESGTTAQTLDHLEQGRRTVRDTLSIILVGKNGKFPMLALHKEPFGKNTPPIHRAAVFGGGLESDEERQFQRMLREDPLAIDPSLAPNGKYPPDYFYRRQGKHMLERGSLQQMHYSFDSEQMQKALESMRASLRKRLEMEVGEEALSSIDMPVLLRDAEPVITHVLNRRLSDYTEAIATKHGMDINASKELVGIGISVRERFAIAKLLTDPLDFAEKTKGATLVWDADHLIAIAERDTASLDAWKKRMEHQANDDELPIRNHSLLVAAQASMAHLAHENGWKARLSSIIPGWLKPKWGRQTNIAA